MNLNKKIKGGEKMVEKRKIIEAKERAVAALEEMKRQEDEFAARDAGMDAPNADYHYEMAQKAKERIDFFIKALKAEPWESINSRAMDAIVEAIIG